MGKKRITQKNLIDNALAQQESASLKPKSKKNKESILGIDWGEKYCGFAYSPDHVVVLALEVCKSEIFEETLNNIIDQKNITLLVWGVPKGLTENLVAKEVKKLVKKQDLPSVLIDERGSSQLCISSDKNQRIDDLAAAQILEFYLDKH